jgi:chemotaxis signal transduction protein
METQPRSESSASSSVPVPAVRGPVLVLRASPHALAVSAGAVEEILDAAEYLGRGGLTRVPRAPAFLVGLVNLRGDPVPLVDFATLLGVTPTAPLDGRAGRVAVVVLGAHRLCLRCDGILGVVDVDRLANGQVGEPVHVHGESLDQVVTAELDCAYGVVSVVDLPRLFAFTQRRATLVR